jgi:hypothetical protein
MAGPGTNGQPHGSMAVLLTLGQPKHQWKPNGLTATHRAHGQPLGLLASLNVKWPASWTYGRAITSVLQWFFSNGWPPSPEPEALCVTGWHWEGPFNSSSRPHLPPFIIKAIWLPSPEAPTMQALVPTWYWPHSTDHQGNETYCTCNDCCISACRASMPPRAAAV